MYHVENLGAMLMFYVCLLRHHLSPSIVPVDGNEVSFSLPNQSPVREKSYSSGLDDCALQCSARALLRFLTWRSPSNAQVSEKYFAIWSALFNWKASEKSYIIIIIMMDHNTHSQHYMPCYIMWKIWGQCWCSMCLLRHNLSPSTVIPVDGSEVSFSLSNIRIKEYEIGRFGVCGLVKRDIQ